MSVKVEVDILDAVLLARLRDAKAVASMSWDSNIREDVKIKVELTYPLGSKMPTKVMDTINACITDCITAFGDSERTNYVDP